MTAFDMFALCFGLLLVGFFSYQFGFMNGEKHGKHLAEVERLRKLAGELEPTNA